MRLVYISSAYVSSETYIHLMHYNASTRYDWYELRNCRMFVMTLLVIALPFDDEEAIVRLLCIYAELDAIVEWMVVEGVHSIELMHEHYYNP